MNAMTQADGMGAEGDSAETLAEKYANIQKLPPDQRAAAMAALAAEVANDDVAAQEEEVLRGVRADAQAVIGLDLL